eukprot:1921886-Prymnesium_polylepis.1
MLRGPLLGGGFACAEEAALVCAGTGQGADCAGSGGRFWGNGGKGEQLGVATVRIRAGVHLALPDKEADRGVAVANVLPAEGQWRCGRCAGEGEHHASADVRVPPGVRTEASPVRRCLGPAATCSPHPPLFLRDAVPGTRGADGGRPRDGARRRGGVAERA